MCSAVSAYSKPFEAFRAQHCVIRSPACLVQIFQLSFLTCVPIIPPNLKLSDPYLFRSYIFFELDPNLFNWKRIAYHYLDI
ncbi:hypothetical protein CW304_13210 [Bacillus sp. UFRGS-B20]|nr:hypothetical protein CW304_13210 [Bacillus sp. UFRGS-B20]